MFSRLEIFFSLALLFLLIVAGAYTTITGTALVWGLIPWGSRTVFVIIPLALVNIALLSGLGGERLESLVQKSAGLLNRYQSQWSRLLKIAFFIIIPVAVAWYWRSRNHFHGDCWAFIQRLEQPFFLLHNEPLSFFLNQLTQRVFQFFGHGSGELVYAVSYCLLLPLFLLLCWKIVSLLTENITLRFTSWIVLFSTISLQFFFGYAECYPVVHLFLALYLLVSLKHLKKDGKPKPWLPTILFLLVTASHKSGAVLFPSVLYLWITYFYQVKKYRLSPSALVFIVCALLFGGILFVADLSMLVPLYGPIDGADNPYHLLSGKHFWDKFNFLLLVIPVSVSVLPLLVMKARQVYNHSSPVFIFVLWCAFGCSFFSFVANPLLGMRDWDLISLPAIPLALFSVMAVLYLFNSAVWKRDFLAALALFSLVHVSTWIWINSSMDRGVVFLDRLRNEDYHKGSNKVQLGAMLFDNCYRKEGIRQYQTIDFNLKGWGDYARLNLGKLFLKNVYMYPDSTIYYCKPMFSKHAMNTEESKPYYSLLIKAYDLKIRPDSANFYYVLMKKKGLSFNQSEKKELVADMQIYAEIYNERLKQKPLDPKLIHFFLRYYTWKNDIHHLRMVYDFISQQDLTDEDLRLILEFIRVCGHEDYSKLLMNRKSN